MTIYFCVLVIALACILSRLPFLARASSDRATHLWLIQTYQKMRRQKDSRLADSIQNGKIFYPPVPHILLAYLPRRLWALGGTALNFASDLALGTGLFLLLGGVVPSTREFALLAALLWLTLPILHPINARLIGLGSRCLGPMIFALYFAGLYLVAAGRPSLGLFVAASSGVLMLLSSQFGTQALVFASILSAAIAQTWLPLLGLAAVFIVSLAVPPLDIAAQLRAKFYHYQWYWREGRRFVGRRNKLSHLWQLLWAEHGWSKACLYLAESVTPVVVVIGLAGVFVILLIGSSHAFDWQWPSLQFGTLHGLAATLSLASLGPCLLTIRGPLVMLGEAERYVEYASPWIVIAVLLALPQDTTSVNVVLAWGIMANAAGIFLNLSILLQKSIADASMASPSPELRQLIDALAGRPGSRIVTSPLTLASEIALYDATAHKYLHLLVGDALGRPIHWPSGEAVYPFIALDACTLRSRWGADLVIVDKSLSMRMTGAMAPDRLTDASVWFDNARYIVYAL